jgi:type IV pilus assembly protein PilA
MERRYRPVGTTPLEGGFTLIELMVVVLVIAILLAIAIPAYLGSENRARDRAAQSDLRTALTAARILTADQDGFFRKDPTAALDVSTIRSVEAAVKYQYHSPLADPVNSSDIWFEVAPAPFDSIAILKRSASGTYFSITAYRTGHLVFCRGPVFDTSVFSVTADLGTGAGACGTKW